MSGKNADMVCGSCKLWRRTRRHGSRGGTRLACGAELDEHRMLLEEGGARYFMDTSRGYGPRHICHRPDDFERKDL